MERLPGAPLDMIFSKLKQDDFANMRACCKTMMHTANSYAHTMTLDARHALDLIGSDLMRDMDSLRILEISFHDDDNMLNVMQLILTHRKAFNRATTVSLTNNSDSQLKVVVFINMLSCAMPEINHLTLFGDFDLAHQECMHALNRFHKLKSLTIDNEFRRTTIPVDWICNFTELQLRCMIVAVSVFRPDWATDKLVISECDFDMGVFPWFNVRDLRIVRSNAPQLVSDCFNVGYHEYFSRQVVRSIHLENSPDFLQYMLSFPQSFKGLRVLTLHNDIQDSDDDNDSDNDDNDNDNDKVMFLDPIWPILASTLTELTLSSEFGYNNHSGPNSLQALSNLVAFTWHLPLRKVTDPGFLPDVLSGMTSLQRLNLVVVTMIDFKDNYQQYDVNDDLLHAGHAMEHLTSEQLDFPTIIVAACRKLKHFKHLTLKIHPYFPFDFDDTFDDVVVVHDGPV